MEPQDYVQPGSTLNGPESLGDLDFRSLNAFIVNEEGDLVLVVHDGDNAVHFQPGAGDSLRDALIGAERLATVALQWVELARGRRATRHLQEERGGRR